MEPESFPSEESLRYSSYKDHDMTDSYSVSDSEPESESESESESTKIPESVIDKLDIDEILEMEMLIYEYIDEFAQTEVANMHNSRYQVDFTHNITNLILDIFEGTGVWSNNGGTDEDSEECYDDIFNFVEKRVQVYFESIPYIPARSLPDTRILMKPNVPVMQKHIEYLRAIPQQKQRTKEWYEFRHTLITASNIGKIFSTESQSNSLIYDKCKPFDITGSIFNNVNVDSPLHWGNKYEPLTVMLYEKTYNTKVADFGCIRHPQYDFIGASPDGINVDPTSDRYGRMIEVKNIVNREIDGIPSDLYWIQMQVQMATCGLDECDFIETRFKEYPDGLNFYEDVERDERGVILYFVTRNMGLCSESSTENNSPHYVYMPFHIPLTKEAIDEWTNTKKAELKAEYTLYTTLYWYLDEVSCVLVQRNKLWFEKAVGKIRDTWDIILKERITGYDHRMPKKKQNQPIVMMSTGDSTNRQIKNLHLTNRVCLVRLDHK